MKTPVRRLRTLLLVMGFSAGIVIIGLGSWIFVDVASASTSDTPALAAAEYVGLIAFGGIVFGAAILAFSAAAAYSTRILPVNSEAEHIVSDRKHKNPYR